jgi:hypothetical protein
MEQQYIDSLLGGETDGQNSLTSSIDGLFTYLMIASFILTVVIVALWIASWLHRRKVENAIIDIKNILNEMNEREKSRSVPVVPPKSSPSNGRHIAVTESDASAHSASA